MGLVVFSELEEFAVLDDEQVAERARCGDDAALNFLLHKYRGFVQTKARSYFLMGADHEDIVQEGMIGLYKAIRDFRMEKPASFRAFAELCVTRQIITAVKTASRQKHAPLNTYISLHKPIHDEESERTLLDIISSQQVADPEELLIDKEEFDHMCRQMNELLSDLEKEVLICYLEGKSYQEIATMLKRHVKSIDNALQRIKRKVERFLTERDVAV
ncbi:MAG TPA: RNA polymerase sporulation sigma factor SigH [Firmicutes bacterium]|jgi:RNA polymerase sporulation-specific sigma factor|nr:RNA polymerase sporulation sigma factor SigH [Bacillota bacterium]